MRNRLIASLALVCLLGGCLAWGQGLAIQPLPSQGAIVGEDYSLPLTATGGTGPYTWSLASGDLPPGLRLQRHAGKIVGTPTTAGSYHFTVLLTDSSIPQMQLQRELTIHIVEGLSVDWQDAPRVRGDRISGSAVVTNQTGHDFDLTVIVVAVNQIGRATTLGYQHFTLPAGSTSELIPFGSSPGAGRYYVRVDAAAHRPGKKRIFRASKQTPDSIKVQEL